MTTPDFTPSPNLYPFRSRWFPSTAGRVHYIDEGSGRPILLLHGNPTWSFLYRNLIRQLIGQFRCIAPDYLGFGLSERPPGFGYTPAEHTSVVTQLIRELDLADLIIMGHDWGGPIGLAAAADHADRVSGLVLGNTWFWPMDRRGRTFSRVMSSKPMQRRILERNLFIERLLPRQVRRELTDEEMRHYRGVQPTAQLRIAVAEFVRPPYEQFSESRVDGAFTFTTGAGGFLQELLYGYTGFRWRGDRIRLDPSLPPQLTGVTDSAVHWHGRVLRIEVGPEQTRVSLVAGPPVTVETPAGTQTLSGTLTLPTRRPDQTPTADIARCRPTLADPATAEPAEAAADGTDITQWIGPTADASIRVDLGQSVPIGTVLVTRSPVTTFAVPNGKGVTKPTQSAGERVEASVDGTTWRVLGTVTAPTLRDEVAGDGQPARYVRLVALGATEAVPLIVGELSVQAQ